MPGPQARGVDIASGGVDGARQTSEVRSAVAQRRGLYQTRSGVWQLRVGVGFRVRAEPRRQALEVAYGVGRVQPPVPGDQGCPSAKFV